MQEGDENIMVLGPEEREEREYTGGQEHYYGGDIERYRDAFEEDRQRAYEDAMSETDYWETLTREEQETLVGR